MAFFFKEFLDELAIQNAIKYKKKKRFLLNIRR